MTFSPLFPQSQAESVPITVLIGVANSRGVSPSRLVWGPHRIVQLDNGTPTGPVLSANFFIHGILGRGGEGLTVTESDQIGGALEEAHKHGGPVVLYVKVDPAASHRDCSDYDAL